MTSEATPKVPPVFRLLLKDLADSVLETEYMTIEAARSLFALDHKLTLSKAVDALVGMENDPETVRRRERDKATIDLLERQKEQGFPTLHGMASIAIWSELEAYVDDIAANFLSLNDRSWSGERIAKLRLPVADFVSMTVLDRAEWCVRQLFGDAVHDRRIGIGRFESLLDAIGLLRSPVAAPVPHILAELHAVRNLLAHRRGRIDKRFLEALGRSDLEVGGRWLPNLNEVRRYAAAVISYAASVSMRINLHYGADVSKQEHVLKASEDVLALFLRAEHDKGIGAET